VVTSVDAGSAEQQLAAYASSKAALTMGVQTIALDYARTGINFNLLAPGPMRAGLFERHLASAADPAQFLATREARQPIGRIIGADEVANAALFLLTEQASALFATTVTADGGLTASFDYRTGAEGSSA
jgi:2,3-dihydro-2,3-dihydroxybenzoate dehydrogenase